MAGPSWASDSRIEPRPVVVEAPKQPDVVEDLWLRASDHPAAGWAVAVVAVVVIWWLARLIGRRVAQHRHPRA